MTTNDNKLQKPNKVVIKIPEWIDQSTWDSFLEMRKKTKKPATDRAKEMVIGDLTKFKEKGDDPNAILNQSILHNWAGVFRLKGDSDYQINSKRQPLQSSEQIAKENDEFLQGRQ